MNIVANMKIRRRKTIFSLTAALGVVACVFLVFQFSSMGVIDNHRQRVDGRKDLSQKLETSKKSIKDEKSDISCTDDDCGGSLQKDAIFQKAESKSHNISNKFGADQNVQEQNIGKAGVDYPIGINRKLLQKYKADARNMFTCLISGEKIPFSQVNDDYCDCADASDEPGTSACTYSRFYCSFQHGGITLHDIPSSKVNDGICDCCDGSDEWKNVTLPSHVSLNDNLPHYGIYQVPCSNRCDKQVAASERDVVMHQKGALLKEKYIQQAEGQANPDMLYGPEGEFYKLSQNCYEAKADKYTYSVCPFQHIVQQQFPSSTTNIGKNPEWVKSSNALVLKMSRGDSKQCPGVIRRETFLKFECGLTDHVISVQETEVCQYTIAFSTPAAC